MGNKLFLMCCIVFFSFFNLGTASSFTTTQTQHFSLSGPAQDSAAGSITIDPFDSALGTLDSVDVSFNGNLAVSGQAAFNLVTWLLIPTSYSISYDLLLTVGGSAFSFDTPLRLNDFKWVHGAGENISLNGDAGFDFSFDASSDLAGVTFPTNLDYSAGFEGPTSIAGIRANFLDGQNSPYNIYLTYIGVFVSPPVTQTELLQDINGSFEITYNYSLPQPAPVPVPATMLLMGSGLTGLIAIRKKY